MGICEGESYI